MGKVKVKDVVHEKSVRKTFSKIGDFVEIPNLLKVQKDSYDWFIKEGLGEVLRDISPIEDYSGNLVLEFFDYYSSVAGNGYAVFTSRDKRERSYYGYRICREADL